MRFVLHHHITEPDHHDLMVEHGDILLTWRIASEEIANLEKHQPVQGERIQDHHKKFLEYEGPLSPGKGRVEKIDTGTCKITSLQENSIDISINGTLLKGQLLINRNHDDTVSIHLI